MPLVAANGLQFHVQDLGAEGPPLVMVHGLLIGSLASWYFTAAPALARRHRVRLYDLRGHGKSAFAATGYDSRTMARDLAALAGDEPVDVVGHSWGALVALRFALAHPARVRRLALVEAPLPPSLAVDFATLDAAQLVEALPATMARGRRLRTMHRLVLETSLVDDLRAEPDISDEELAAICCPMLAIYGDRSSCAAAAARFARSVVLPGGHYLHLDAKDALTATLVEFLDG